MKGFRIPCQSFASLFPSSCARQFGRAFRPQPCAALPSSQVLPSIIPIATHFFGYHLIQVSSKQRPKQRNTTKDPPNRRNHQIPSHHHPPPPSPTALPTPTPTPRPRIHRPTPRRRRPPRGSPTPSRSRGCRTPSLGGILPDRQNRRIRTAQAVKIRIVHVVEVVARAQTLVARRHERQRAADARGLGGFVGVGFAGGRDGGDGGGGAGLVGAIRRAYQLVLMVEGEGGGEGGKEEGCKGKGGAHSWLRHMVPTAAEAPVARTTRVERRERDGILGLFCSFSEASW